MRARCAHVFPETLPDKPYMHSATLSVTNGTSHYSPGSYAPAHLVWVERMIMYYSSARKKTLFTPPAAKRRAG